MPIDMIQYRKEQHLHKMHQDHALSTKTELPWRDKGQGIRDQRQKKRERRKGAGRRGRDICPRGTKDYFQIERRQTWPTGKMWAIKGKGKCHISMSSLILIGHVNQGSQKRVLISRLQYFDNRTLVVSYGTRKRPNKGIDLAGQLQGCNLTGQ